MHEQTRHWIRRHGVPAPGDHVVCAVSGGADSVALLHLLRDLAPEIGFTLTVAHFNHRIRGASAERDQRFVQALAAELSLPCRAGRAPARLPAELHHLSPEARARWLRRRFLLRTAAELGAGRIALAHHLDDQAETVLMRALSGTSLSGLGAMPPMSPDGRWIRPLLGVRRAAIRGFLRARGIAWVEDETNREGRLPRSRLRSEVLPLIEERLSDRAAEALARLADEARSADRYLSAAARRALDEVSAAVPGADPAAPDEIRLETARLGTYDVAVQRYVLRLAYESVRGSRADLTRDHLAALERLIERQGAVHLPGEVRAFREHGRLAITRRAETGAAWGPVSVTPRSRVEVPALELRLDCRLTSPASLSGARQDDAGHTAFDHDRLRPPLTLRSWRPGDRFVPLGMSGSQKISDLFTDRKVPRRERDRVPILSDADGILWVVGYRRSNRARVTAATRRVLEVLVNLPSGAE